MKNIILIPALGEKSGLAALLERIPSTLNAQVLILDGGQNGWEKGIRETVTCLVVPPGNGNAIRAGFTYALQNNYETIYRIDSDYQYDPALLPLLQNKLNLGADFIIGARYHPNANCIGTKPPDDRVLLNLMVRDTINRITNLTLHDVVSGLWCLRRSVVEYLLPRLQTEGYGLTMEIILKLWHAKNFTISEVPHIACYSGTPKLDGLYGNNDHSLANRTARLAEYLTVITKTLHNIGITDLWNKLIQSPNQNKPND